MLLFIRPVDLLISLICTNSHLLNDNNDPFTTVYTQEYML